MNIISDKELNMLIDIYKDYENLHEEAIYEAAAELKHYRELAAQGRLIELPCAVGDKVYQISEGFIEPCTVEAISLTDYMDKDGRSDSYMIEIHYDREDYPYVSTDIYFTDIGKTVFTTKEAAEARLAEIEGAE